MFLKAHFNSRAVSFLKFNELFIKKGILLDLCCRFKRKLSTSQTPSAKTDIGHEESRWSNFFEQKKFRVFNPLKLAVLQSHTQNLREAHKISQEMETVQEFF